MALGPDLQEEAVLDAAQAGQRGLAADRILDLEHHRGDQLGALRDQRIVGRQLVGDLRRPAALGQQHLLDLEEHGVEALEIDRAVRPQLHPAQALDRQQRRAALLAHLGELGVGQQVGAGHLAKVGGHGQSQRP